MDKNVTIYTSSLCGFCYRAKSLLKREGISYKEIDVDLNKGKQNEMVKKSNGKTSVPQIFFKNHHIGGCEDLFKLKREKGLELLKN